MKVGDLVKLGEPARSAAGYTVCVLRTADKENKEVRILDFDLEVVNASR
mgnify:CR=1 FL=1